jgi:hypothetical protein
MLKIFFFILFVGHIVIGSDIPVGVVDIIHDRGIPAHGIGTLIKIDNFPNLDGRLVLTARHVIEDAENVYFTFQERRYRGDERWYHPYPPREGSDFCSNAADIAILVLKEKCCDATPVPVQINPKIERGETVISISCSRDPTSPRLVEFQVRNVVRGIIELKCISSNLFSSGDSGAPIIQEVEGHKVIVGVYIASPTHRETAVSPVYLGGYSLTLDSWREPTRVDISKNILEVFASNIAKRGQ